MKPLHLFDESERERLTDAPLGQLDDEWLLARRFWDSYHYEIRGDVIVTWFDNVPGVASVWVNDRSPRDLFFTRMRISPIGQARAYMVCGRRFWRVDLPGAPYEGFPSRDQAIEYLATA